MSEKQEPTLGDVLGAVQALAGHIEALGGRVEALDAKVEAQGRQVGSAIASLRSDLDKAKFDLMARIDRVQDTVTAMRDDITVNFGRSDQAEMVIGAHP